ncbi:MAG TPA: hypothetical protein VNE39_17970 [Planctomycetota bacterium]|nr:hypothetical protein [Planctomycetota bacterium]
MKKRSWQLLLVTVILMGGVMQAQESRTPAPPDPAVLRERIKEAEEQLKAAQQRLAALQAELAEAERRAMMSVVDRARGGDDAALRQVLDSLAGGNFVDYAWARAVKGPGVDSAKVVAAIREKLRVGDPALRCKLCWLLGQNASAAAAALLREVLAKEADENVVGNAIFALSRCPDAPANVEAVRRHVADQRALTQQYGFYARGSYPRQPLGLLAKQYVDRRSPAAFATVPGEVVVEEPTLFCAGFQWRIEGDGNHNCAVQVEYRKAGDAAWRTGFPLLRCESWESPDPKYPFDVGNLLAGSLFDLEPGTAYEVKLTLKDPDGGEGQHTVTVTTRTEPPHYEGLRTLYVVPGTGGGTGTREAPFEGIAAADTAAQPGDVFLLLPGTYGGSVGLKKSGQPGKPIVWRGTDRTKVILDGSGKDESLSFSGQGHLQFEDLTFIGAKQGCIKAFGNHCIVVRRCTFRNYRYAGIMAQGSAEKVRDAQVVAPARNSRNWFVTDNEFYGPADWRKGRKGSSYGIVLSGAGHVIAWNRTQDCWDTISLAGGRGEPRSGSLDICYNDLRQATDDGVEADYVYHNTRIYRNRLTNTFSSLSSQPAFGGPTYMLYNAMYNTTNKPFKLHVNTTGAIIAHNTCAASREAFYGGSFHDAHFWNNLLLGLPGEQGYWMSTQGHPLEMDYTGYHVAAASSLIKLNNVRYQTMEEFAEDTGQMKHAVKADWQVFVNAPQPAGHGTTADPAAVDLRLRSGSAAVDRGVLLPGINDGFTGKAPDLGCHEQGESVPHYGPRGAVARPVTPE